MLNLYYMLKALIPRRLQLFIRRKLIELKLPACKDIWPINEKASKPPETWTGWPQGKRFALVLTHDVDTAVGQERCYQLMQLEESLGFRSSFYFVPERYKVSAKIRDVLIRRGFEVGVHGLRHDGKLYQSYNIFVKRAAKINAYLKEWNAVGFRSPAMHHNLDWIHELNIEYDASTFDTDPFEPHPSGVETIFPFWVRKKGSCGGYVELPYTLPQDHALFVVMQKRSISIWKQKIDWIAGKGGMALLLTHPDYMSFENGNYGIDTYPVYLYEELLKYIKMKYEGRYWHVLAHEMSRFIKQKQ